MKNIKKILIPLFLSIIVVIFTSCNDFFSENEKKSFRPKKYLDKYGQNIIDAFLSEDTELLKSLFCEGIVQTHDLDEEINNAYIFFGDKVSSYDDIWSDSIARSDRDSETVKLNGVTIIKGIRTNNGDNFKIRACCVLIYENDTSHVGIQMIQIYNSFGEEYEIGDCLKGSWN